MPEEATISESKHADHKSWSRLRWLEKLSRSEGKTSKDFEIRDQDIQSFLHRPTGVNVEATPTLRLSLQADPSQDTEQSSDIPAHEIKRKQSRKPGLHVTFADTAPVIIGEGGDEAALPVIELLSSLESSTGLPTEASTNAYGQPPGNALQTVEVQGTERDSLRPRHLQRRSTGLQDDEPDEFAVHEPGSPNRHKNLPPRPTASLSQLQDERLEEGQDTEERLSTLRDISPSERLATDGGVSADNRKKERAIQQHTGLSKLQSRYLNPATSFANSLTPSPSPQYPGGQHASPERSYPFPPTPPVNVVRLVSTDSQALERVQQQRRPQILSKSSSDNRGLSLRDVARTLGDDAFHDFATRVQPFGNIFRLGLDSHREPTLEQWVMAASWWFLKGRSGLESSVRSRPRDAAIEEVNVSDMPLDLKQAYIDLAKTWWIVSKMVPNDYPEVKKLEHKGPVHISTIVQSFVHAKTAELIQIYLSIVSNLRALTMSMRKNSRMPPSGIELQGLDARIFLAYPLLSPGAARLLSVEILGRLANERHDESESFFPMPIADTERHFNYGRMFVNVVLDQAKAGSALSIPCLLSILRERRDREITVVAASQDGQVHLVIQPDANKTLSWCDVRWRLQQRCLDVVLRADFELEIRFAENDFKTLWGINDHIRTVQKASQSAKTEALVLEVVLRSFQWLEQDSSTAQFPAGQVEGCMLRLFECFMIVNESTDERKVHDGFRMMVVTPHKTKKLSSVSLSLGAQTPIIFSYLRDEQGAPAMLLKTSKSSRHPYVVIGFQDAAGRDSLYSLLSGTALSSEEHCSETLSLETLAFSSESDEERWATDHTGALGSLSTRGLKVFRQHLQPKQQPKHLGIFKTRLWIECKTGCFADRINLGIAKLLPVTRNSLAD